MALFQKSVLNKFLKLQNQQAIEKAYKKFTKYFHNVEIQQNIHDSKEEQFQEGFLRELFVNILGYTLNPRPNYNLTTELKNEKGAKKADGAILQNGKALAVIELKGTDTKDLDKINIQAFNYKNNQTGCIYVITSNFEKLRFFIHNSVDHIEFNLFTLNQTEFELLWMCLNADNLLGGLPLRAKEESVLAEEHITKQLYKDYSTFKIAMWQNMVKNSPGADQLLLFKKTQKLLDRFLFIFFAEDSGLLPPNSISRMVKRWEVLKEEDAYKPLYEIFKQYFEYINIGRKGKSPQDDIYAYNGGLFLSDDVLNNIVIDDEVLHPHVMKLTTYDFQSEVNVNILGHIFENSLNEIENVIAKLEGKEVDKSKTKRKKDGVYYTPKYITKYIVDNTIGKLCEGKKAELGIIDEEYAKGRSKRKKETIRKLDKSLQTYREWLLNVTICDPACGSGAFLNQALEYLIAEHSYIDELESQLLGYSFEFPGVENHILEKNIYGVDINEESVEIAKLSLWLRTAQRGRKLTSLNNNLKCGNSLIDDPEVAGNKAFNWQNEFPNIFPKKKKKIWHITWATHNSRTSQRMWNLIIDTGEAVWLDAAKEVIVTHTILEIVKENNHNVMAYNICGDHVHMMIVCEEDKLNQIVAKLKGRSSFVLNRTTGIHDSVKKASNGGVSYEEVSDPDRHIPDGERSNRGMSDEGASIPEGLNRGVNPSGHFHEQGHDHENEHLHEHTPIYTHAHAETTRYADGTIKPTWARKFNTSYITNDEKFENTLRYIQNNRNKHELPENKELQPIIDKMLCSREHAFRTEYKGGFDVVIGNPPYVSKTFSDDMKKYIKSNYQTAEYQLDLYISFMEKATLLACKCGMISYIVPNSWLKNLMFRQCRYYLATNLSFEVIVPNLENVFNDASVDTLIFISKNLRKVENEIIIGQFINSYFSFKHKIPQDRFLKNEKFICFIPKVK